MFLHICIFYLSNIFASQSFTAVEFCQKQCKSNTSCVDDCEIGLTCRVALNDHYDICDVGYRLCLDKGNADEHCSTSRTFCFHKCDLLHDKCLHKKDVKSYPSLPASAAVLFQASKELFATIPNRNGIPCETRCDEEVETCQRRCASRSCRDGCWHMRHGCIDECRPERDLAIQQILAHPAVSCAANCSAQKAECINSCRGDSQCLAKCDNKHFVCEQLCRPEVAYRSGQSRCTDDCQSVFVGCLSFVQGISKEEAATRCIADRERCFHKCDPKKKERATQLLSTAQDPVAPKEWNSVNTNTQSVAPTVNKNASFSTPSRYPTLEQSEDSPQFSYELCDEMCRRAESACQTASRGDKLLSLQCLAQKKECSHLCVDENNPLPTTPCTPRCHEGYQKCSSQCDSSFSSADERSECDSECWRERSSCVRRCPFSPDEDVSQCDLSCHAAFEEGLEKCGEADLSCLETITSQRKDCFSLCKSPAELKLTPGEQTCVSEYDRCVSLCSTPDDSCRQRCFDKGNECFVQVRWSALSPCEQQCKVTHERCVAMCSQPSFSQPPSPSSASSLSLSAAAAKLCIDQCQAEGEKCVIGCRKISLSSCEVDCVTSFETCSADCDNSALAFAADINRSGERALSMKEEQLRKTMADECKKKCFESGENCFVECAVQPDEQQTNTSINSNTNASSSSSDSSSSSSPSALSSHPSDESEDDSLLIPQLTEEEYQALPCEDKCEHNYTTCYVKCKADRECEKACRRSRFSCISICESGVDPLSASPSPSKSESQPNKKSSSPSSSSSSPLLSPLDQCISQCTDTFSACLALIADDDDAGFDQCRRLNQQCEHLCRNPPTPHEACVSECDGSFEKCMGRCGSNPSRECEMGCRIARKDCKDGCVKEIETDAKTHSGLNSKNVEGEREGSLEGNADQIVAECEDVCGATFDECTAKCQQSTGSKGGTKGGSKDRLNGGGGGGGGGGGVDDGCFEVCRQSRKECLRDCHSDDSQYKQQKAQQAAEAEEQRLLGDVHIHSPCEEECDATFVSCSDKCDGFQPCETSCRRGRRECVGKCEKEGKALHQLKEKALNEAKEKERKEKEEKQKEKEMNELSANVEADEKPKKTAVPLSSDIPEDNARIPQAKNQPKASSQNSSPSSSSVTSSSSQPTSSSSPQNRYPTADNTANKQPKTPASPLSPSSSSSSSPRSTSSPPSQPSSAGYSSEEDFQAQLDGCNEYCDVLTRGCQSECKYAGFTGCEAECRSQDSRCRKACSAGEDPPEPISNAERWKKCTGETGVSLDDCVRSCEGSTINSPGEYDACYNKCRNKRKTSLELCDRIYKGPYKDTNSDRNTGLTSSSVNGQSDASESGWSQESDLLPQTALLRLCQSSCSTGFNDCSAKCERSGAGRACHDDCMGSRRRCEAQCTEDYSSKPKEEEGKEVKLDCTGQCKASLHSCLEMCLGNSICESQCVAQARDCEARCSQPKDLCSRVCAAERAKCQASCNGRLSCEKQCQRGEVECIPLCLNERGDPKCIGECREKQMLCEGSCLTSRKEDCSAGCAKNYRQCANSCVREDDGGDDPANPLQSQSVDASLSEQNERDRKTTQQKQEEEEEESKEYEERYPTAQQSAASQSSGDGEVASPEECKRWADGPYVDTLMNKCSSIQNPRCYDEIWTKHSKLLKACQTQNSAILTTFVCEYYCDEQFTECFNTCGKGNKACQDSCTSHMNACYKGCPR
ncbi:uncharacterized protein MONOS_5003 [Monocercomonoides exilis]|uniref:uncharacterized protein n=1 Tax=Monocercomonoides exilis TaxID=2049356 RepID=UPI00355A2539|nr:hypothetical protein MONOS_5003 [Monocercomonoides exilis]|eukprot:MONOS_5003.1-p1 / transcript=MONOS_5003.1 / gene=MONOS_5003 / organism=Monocercomonoides_exilis_PA203 / gene_product=unspecified product / transcript_product=unspecified product / location=Mono_scaffold00140:95458-101448(+) / protein_length=1723 / sequence_SO=supercontig / SO=protein_coding / is_pseudo=false